MIQFKGFPPGANALIDIGNIVLTTLLIPAFAFSVLSKAGFLIGIFLPLRYQAYEINAILPSGPCNYMYKFNFLPCSLCHVG